MQWNVTASFTQDVMWSNILVVLTSVYYSIIWIVCNLCDLLICLLFVSVWSYSEYDAMKILKHVYWTKAFNSTLCLGVQWLCYSKCLCLALVTAARRSSKELTICSSISSQWIYSCFPFSAILDITWTAVPSVLSPSILSSNPFFFSTFIILLAYITVSFGS